MGFFDMSLNTQNRSTEQRKDEQDDFVLLNLIMNKNPIFFEDLTKIINDKKFSENRQD